MIAVILGMVGIPEADLFVSGLIIPLYVAYMTIKKQLYKKCLARVKTSLHVLERLNHIVDFDINGHVDASYEKNSLPVFCQQNTIIMFRN